uniref:ethanolamine kinase n=1 Tax=Rhizochromulina marina TaxID=1034831 RepID=A0A7S2WU47_9STRA|mmetsp:Transcript_5487/g.16169  ORF Transcript_5487/g.16169 Transcript_5487/m.16169 type:complete len:488 (+) Transcript_5487:80-1543(+)
MRSAWVSVALVVASLRAPWAFQIPIPNASWAIGANPIGWIQTWVQRRESWPPISIPYRLGNAVFALAVGPQPNSLRNSRWMTTTARGAAERLSSHEVDTLTTRSIEEYAGEIPNTHVSQIIAALRAAGAKVEDTPRMSKLSAGFCNWVYRVELTPPTEDLASVATPPESPEHPGESKIFVVKILSDLAKIRLAPEHRGVVDWLSSELSVSPRVMLTTPDLIVHEWVHGRTLTEEEIASDSELRTSIAQQLGLLHSAVTPIVFNGSEPILWSAIDKMLAHIGRRPELIPAPFTMPMLLEECQSAKEALGGLPLEIVMGHGDFKPSNVMTDNLLGSDKVLFIDFELAGPNYRGFDIFKLFRRGQPADGGDPPALERDNMESFVNIYLDAYAQAVGNTPGREAETVVAKSSKAQLTEKVVAEVLLFEPLTWLEAAVFFLFAIQEDQDNVDKWTDLAKHRWGKYMESKPAIEENARILAATQYENDRGVPQ